MADGGGDRLPANCGVQLNPKGDSYVLTYKMGKNFTMADITWQWVQKGESFVAQLEGKSKRGNIRYHNSAPIDAEIHSALSKPDLSLDGEYYMVKFHVLKSKKKPGEMPNLSEFFDVPQ